MNKYNVYTVFTYVNVTEVTARNEKSAINKIRDMAQSLHIELHEGVYLMVLGPNFETAAEIKAFQMLIVV